MALPEIKVRVSADTASAEAGLDRVERGLQSAGAQASRTGMQMRSATAHTANLGAQFNDIGVMLASGQSPLMLAVQQGTQINQVLGQVGTTGRDRLRALGAAFMSVVSPVNLATIGIIAGGAALLQWGIRALSAGSSAEDLQKQLESLSSQVDAYRESTKSAQFVTAELRQEFGRFAEGAFQVQQILQAADYSETKRGLEGLTRSLSEFFDVQDRVNAVEIAEFFDMTGLFTPFISLTEEAKGQVYDLQQAFIDFKAAATLDEQVQSGTELLDQFVALAAQTDGINDTEREFIDLLGGAILEMQRLQAATDGVAASADAAARALSLAQSKLNAQSLEGGGRGGDPRDFAGEVGTRLDAGELIAEDRRQESGSGRRRGGGGGNSLAEQMKRRLETLVDSLKTERETLEEWYSENLELLKTANEAELEALGGFNEARLRLEEEYQERLAKVRKLAYQDSLRGTLKAGEDIAAALGQTSEKAFRISKAFGSAIALINAYQAASETLKDPTLPWWARVSAAASVLAAGIGFVNSIKAVTEGGGGGGATATAGAGRAGAIPEGPAQSAAQDININLAGDNFSRASVLSLIAGINEAVGDGARIRAS